MGRRWLVSAAASVGPERLSLIHIFINITSSPDIALDEIDTASQIVTERAHEDANIIWGATFDESMEDEMSVPVIATGFQGSEGDKKDPLDVDMDLDDRCV